MNPRELADYVTNDPLTGAEMLRLIENVKADPDWEVRDVTVQGTVVTVGISYGPYQRERCWEDPHGEAPATDAELHLAWQLEGNRWTGCWVGDLIALDNHFFATYLMSP